MSTHPGDHADLQPLSGVLETALYYSEAQREEVHRLYTEVLGLRVVAGWDDGTSLRLGDGVLLLFCRELLEGREGPIADHGTAGPGHVCLLAPGGAYDEWRGRVASAGVEIVHDHEWGAGRRSFYFRDPAGNLLEVASADLWPA